MTERCDHPAWSRAVTVLRGAEGLPTGPLSDPIEVKGPRPLLRDRLSDVGKPYLIVRPGHHDGAAPFPETPRRQPGDVIPSRSR